MQERRDQELGGQEGICAPNMFAKNDVMPFF